MSIIRTLSQIVNMIPGSQLQGEDLTIKGVSTDSRVDLNGKLFIPLIGEKFDAHQFLPQAIENGASAVLCSRKFSNIPTNTSVILVDDTLEALQKLSKSYLREWNGKIVGITGSNGKTSTKDILTSILSAKYKVHKTQGNFNNHIGLPLTVLAMEEDTEVAVLEMGMSNFGEIEFLSNLAEPDAAIITNIGESHMQELGSRAGIAKAKLEIASGLSKNGLLVINGDEPLLIEGTKDKNLIYTIETFGFSESNDVYPTFIEMNESGSEFEINKAKDVRFKLGVLGKHNISNTLAAIAVARKFSLTWDEISSGMQNLEMTKMRMELLKNENGITIINDAYNASVTSMKAALLFASELKGYHRKFVVFGDMLELGDQEIAFHEEIGEEVVNLHFDFLYTFGPLSKFAATSAFEKMDSSRVKSFEDKNKLIEDLLQQVQPNDLVLVKASRGMKLEEVVNALVNQG
ncbi:UDP-N-acetylmuramoyl-tripeptide--D-alanyl-D-alanine ligase [Bacillus sp. AFS055030]|uniref:UDP-N-acetylmuramoyl-tripeptide--D-alanyl-D- alanine ligase n=1 Tax=Bacillus sp. AFS055030 TaxID=2033507 RepID=UPI000BFDDD00|nr:UDP-N-acetylmuramoyl-tripeptide--D-alanyl-D-alanine ligase [Bacillus sp. AFS055030]PGL70730.1 UDP-N-acetylmuramoyl-tripeptide--D-alanyl-D-alanine ligase [Bacillus sp. AFS055030]